MWYKHYRALTNLSQRNSRNCLQSIPSGGVSCVFFPNLFQASTPTEGGTRGALQAQDPTLQEQRSNDEESLDQQFKSYAKTSQESGPANPMFV